MSVSCTWGVAFGPLGAWTPALPPELPLLPAPLVAEPAPKLPALLLALPGRGAEVKLDWPTWRCEPEGPLLLPAPQAPRSTGTRARPATVRMTEGRSARIGGTSRWPTEHQRCQA